MVSKLPLRNKKILITSGPTWVPIDDMRVISNRSTGEMGRRMAEAFRAAGCRVTLMEGAVPRPGKLAGVKTISFRFFEDLQRQLQKELRRRYDVVIHAAAVSDFRLQRPFRSKISSGRRLTLTLVPTDKLINGIKRINPRVVLVGFKLESRMTAGMAMKEAGKLFDEAGCDIVVANTVAADKYLGFLIDQSGRVVARCHSRKGLAAALLNILTQKVSR